MSEPVTIGDQTFTNDPNKGWIDRKTKLPADKGLVKLLDSLELKPVESRLKIKIDRSREPVFLNGQKFVYDTNSGWIDEKTKIRVPDSLQKIINSASAPAITNMVAATEQVAQAFGVAGTAAKQRVRTKTPSKVGPKSQATANRLANNKNQLAINTQFVKMITHLSSINGLIQQRKEQDIAAARNLSDQLDEAKIENDGNQNSLNNKRPDATKESGPNLLLLAMGGLLIANYIDPIVNLVKTVAEGMHKVGTFTMGVVHTINNVFGGGNKQPATKQPESSNTTSPNIPTEQATPEPTNNTTAIPPRTPLNNVEAVPEPKANEAKGSSAKTSTGTQLHPTKAKSPSISRASVPAMQPSSKPDVAISSPAPVAKSNTKPQTNATPAAKQATSPDATKQGSIKPGDVLNFTSKSGDEAHFNLLEPATKDAVLAAAAEYKQQTGNKLTINSGRRTYAEQKYLYDHPQGHPVARPGTSNHESGWSLDIGQRGEPAAKSILEKHGMMWFGSGDDVHYTLKGHGEGGGGGGDSSSGFMDAAKSVASQGLDVLADLVKGMASIADTNSTPIRVEDIAAQNQGSYGSKSQKMEVAQAERHADLVQATNPPPVAEPTAATLPNLNATNPELGIKTPATNDDKRIVYDYLRYFKVLPYERSSSELVIAK